MSLHPTPHPTPTPRVTQHQPCVQVQWCHYTPPQPHGWRSIKNACKFNDVITPHPPPHPNPTWQFMWQACRKTHIWQRLHWAKQSSSQPKPKRQFTWQARRKTHFLQRLQWPKHSCTRVVTSDWSLKQESFTGRSFSFPFWWVMFFFFNPSTTLRPNFYPTSLPVGWDSSVKVGWEFGWEFDVDKVYWI